MARLPIIFLIDASHAQSGAYGVALRQGLESLAETLRHDRVADRVVYLASIVCNQAILASQHLTAAHYYDAPSWSPAGTLALVPALDDLEQLLHYEIILNDEDMVGDLPPLIFLALGAHADDDWQAHLERIRALPAMRHARVFALLPDRRERDQAAALAAELICVDGPNSSRPQALATPGEVAGHVAAFFDWVAKYVLAIARDPDRTLALLPRLPAGLMRI